MNEALALLRALDLPTAQQNARTALCVMALVDLAPESNWIDARPRLIGITPMMEWMTANFKVAYKPNTRETIRRQSVHQLVEAGIASYNPDDPDRPVNSPNAVYQVTSEALAVIRAWQSDAFQLEIARFKQVQPSLAAQYSRERDQVKVTVVAPSVDSLQLSPGKHSALIAAILEEFGPRFVPGGRLLYAGDTERKTAFFEAQRLAALNVKLNEKGKLPDVILYDSNRNWLVLVEAVTSHGPVDGKRYVELKSLFGSASAGLVFVTAFLERAAFREHVADIAWETEVWVADEPSHLIHFNGERYLGPYEVD